MDQKELDGIRNNSIKELFLQSKKIGENGAKELAQSLFANTCLTSIDLSLNEIGVTGAKKVLSKAYLESSAPLIEILGFDSFEFDFSKTELKLCNNPKAWNEQRLKYLPPAYRAKKRRWIIIIFKKMKS